MFLTDDELGSFLSDMLNQPVGTALLDWQVSIVSQANLTAYWDIVNAFMLRGFTKVVIDQWDRGAEFERAIGIWQCLQEMARRAPDLYSQVALKATDRRPALNSVGLTIAGIWKDPVGPVGLPTVGRRTCWPNDCDTGLPQRRPSPADDNFLTPG